MRESANCRPTTCKHVMTFSSVVSVPESKNKNENEINNHPTTSYTTVPGMVREETAVV